VLSAPDAATRDRTVETLRRVAADNPDPLVSQQAAGGILNDRLTVERALRGEHPSISRACTAFVAAERPGLEDVLTTLRQLQGPSRVERAWLPLAAGLCPDAWQAACAARDELGVLPADGAGLPAFSSAPLDATPYREWLRAPPPDGIFWATRPAGPTPPSLPG
jgi:hypothetical protein